MKKKYIITIMFLVILNFAYVVNANSLNLKLTSSAKSLSIGDEVTVTVDWKEKMQAADFALEYDSEKLEFVEADIGENFTNIKDNQLIVSWFSNNNEDKTSMNFKFKAISDGENEFKINVLGGFATGNLEIPDDYVENSLTIKIKKSNVFFYILLIIVFLILIKHKKTRRKNK